jgi:hypothetical protein
VSDQKLKRPRGNPSWSRGDSFPIPPAGPTQFERYARKLGLDARSDCAELAKSEKLRDWAAKHHASRYVPEPLLKVWGLDSWRLPGDGADETRG